MYQRPPAISFLSAMLATCLGVALPLAAGAEEAQVEGVAFRPERRDATEERIAALRVPPGFRVSVVARDLGAPRMLAIAPDGGVLVTRPEAGDVLVLHESEPGRPPARTTLVSGLKGVHGIAVRDGRAYLATPRQVLVAELGPDGAGPPQVLLDGLPDGGQHPNRTLAFGPDGAIYVSIGSSCNACAESNPEHATLIRADVASARRAVHAEGLRNTIGFAWDPRSGALFGMDHGSDWLGNETPPEEVNRIEAGKHYGWPYCWGERRSDPVMKHPEGEAAKRGATKDAFCANTEPALLGYAAHAAPIAFVFQHGEQFPIQYRGAAFVAMHGSWNRKPAVGYEVVALHFENGRPARFEPFLTGFLIEDGAAQFGRPAGLVVAPDGSLLVSDDENGVLYRVAWTGTQRADR